MCFVVGALFSFAALAQAPRRLPLKQGDELEQLLRGGGADEYQIDLVTGQFLSLVVEQDGIDVTVTLFAPDGHRITTSDSMNEEYGPEPLAAIAQTTGPYRVVVASGNKNCFPGRYRIGIAELRTPAPGDAEHVASEKNVERARELRATGNSADWDAAIAALQEALHYYETAGAQDSHRHGMVLFTIGYSQAQKSRIPESISAYLAALPLFQSAGDAIMEARTLNNLGGEYNDLGEPLKAMAYHKDALAKLPSGKVLMLQTVIINNLGLVNEEMGEWTEALDSYERAASGFGASGNWREQAIAWGNVAYMYRVMNEPEQALRYLDQAQRLMLLKSVRDNSQQAEIFTSRAEVLLSQGKATKALEAAEEALQLRSIAGDLRREGDTLSVLGSVYHSLQQPDKAQQAFQEALAKQQQAGYQFGVLHTLLRMGNFHLSQGKSKQAREELERALNLAAALGCGECKVLAEFGLARAQQELGNISESLQQVRNTVENVEKLRAGIGSSALRASFFGGHESAYELYIDILHNSVQRSVKDDSAPAFQVSERARARSLLDILSGVRPSLGQEDEQLARKEQAVQAELASNAGRLFRLWQDSQNRGSSRKAGDLGDRIAQLEAQYNFLEAEKAAKNPGYAALTQPEYLTAKQVQEELLEDDSIFLEYYLGDKKSYLWAITPNTVASYELPPRERVETAARKFYELLTQHASHSPASSALSQAAKELSNMVLGPVADQLQNRRLIIAADGALQYVPFAALNQPGIARSYKPLVLAHEIVNVPSASAIAAQGEFLAHRVPAERTLAVLADPVFSAQDPRLSSRPAVQFHNVSLGSETRLLNHVQSGASPSAIPSLPFTAIEADKIFALAPAGTSMKAVGFDANRNLAMSAELGEYKYLHFATHGYVDSRHPELSALVLSLLDKDGKVEDGFLRLQDIYNLHLQADLVVLSACETGLGREIRGEGLIGLTRGFMYAGAARVLVSLWDVSDQGTSELMPRFYEHILKQGKTPAAALREAQVSMFKSRQWQDPYYWASFTLQGEWK